MRIKEHERHVALVADDDRMIRLLATELLEGMGFLVVEAADGVEALAAFERSRPEIVLLDVMMPVMDGFTVCGRLRQCPEGAYIPILMMTGLDDIESINRAFEVGATDFISKPINWAILHHRVQYMWRASSTSENFRRSEEKNRALLETIPDLMFHVKHDGTILDFSAPKDFDVELFADESVVNQINGIRIFEKTGILRCLDRALRTGEMQVFEHQLQLNGAQYAYECRVLRSGGDEALAIVRDITQRKQAEQRIVQLGYSDTLTGLLNGRSFKEHLSQALENAMRHERLLATLIIDVDRFKRINDSLGHNIGDLLLQGIADRIQEGVRRSDRAARLGNSAPDMVSRLGGDEFIILLAEISHVQDAAKVARRTLASLSRPFILAGQEIFVTASIGITIYPHDGKDVDALLKNADTAMYNAKEQGRNNYQFYSESMGAVSSERLALETSLRKALEREEFMLYYQPQVGLESGEVVGMEALIRWDHPDRGLVSPVEFIPVAEETGLIGPIGEWVLITACKQHRAWLDSGYGPVRMAVNLSSLQFRQRNLVQDVTKALRTSGMDPSYLELELTESAIMKNTQASLVTLQQFRQMGVRVAIDDFGTGYSSLNYLKRFPLDALKIDRSFIRDIITDQDDAAIAVAIIAMARSLNLRVVAEGVETAEQLNFLQMQQCNEVQGFFFSAALPADQIMALMKEKGYLPCREGNRSAIC